MGKLLRVPVRKSILATATALGSSYGKIGSAINIEGIIDLALHVVESGGVEGAKVVAYIAYDQVNLAIDDVSSQDDYGRRVMSVSIPLQVSGGDALAEQIARYLLGYYAVPQTRIGTVGFEGPETVNGVSLYAIDIGDVVELSETQTAISGMRHWVIGLNYALVAQDLSSITLVLAPLGEHTYLVLDDPVYGLLDQNRLAL